MEHTSLADISAETLRGLIGVSEGRRLEYKRETPGKSEEDRAEFLKDVSALANTDGGDIVYGMAESKGVASAFFSIDNTRLDSEIARLHQILNAGVRPRIPQVQMHSVEVESGKSLLVVRVPASHLGPHQVIAAQSYRFHGRNTVSTYPIEVDELRDKILRQADLPSRMHDFRRSRVDLIRHHPEDMPSPVEFHRKLVMHYMPEQTFGRGGAAEAFLFSNDQYRNQVIMGGELPTYARLGLSYRSNIEGYVFMNGRGDDVLQFYVQVFDDGSLEFVDGGVFRNSADEPLIYHENFEITMFRQYGFASRLFQALNVSGRIAILGTMLGCRDLTINPQAPTRTLDFVGHKTTVGRDPGFLNPVIVDDMASAEPHAALEPLIQQVWRACAYSHAYSYKNGAYVGRNWNG